VSALGLLLFGLLFLIVLLVGIGGTIFWIWMLIDCVTKEPSTGNDKIIWVLVIVLTHLIGALIYYFVRRPRRIQLHGV
jgi:sterol desaturase/sphingolipid hydroxylase (fatty acid hydroxylase superfamily)